MKKSAMVFYLVGAIMIFVSCSKEAGRGGSSSIEGKVYVYDVNGAGDTLKEFYGMEEDVYIIYGENSTIYNDRYRSSYDGSYRFDYLNKGKYTLFAYTRCDTCPDGKTISKQVVDIVDNKTIYTVPNINIRK